MTLKNKLLTYLGFCPSRESAQGFSVVVGATIILYLNQGKYPWDPWRVIITNSIFFAIAHLISANLRMRREAKKEEAVQRRE